MRLFLKCAAGFLAFLAAAPSLAQATGPSGLAEPKAPPTTGTFAAPPAADPANILNIQLSTGGTVSILLRPDKAPLAVERLKVLAARHFYDGLTFHRVIDGFMAQGGDPKGTGEGGSDLPDLKAEFNDLPHVRGVMAMARAGAPDSANSQFYLMLSPNLGLDLKYTIVGRIFRGMPYVDQIAKGEPPANPTRMVRFWFGDPPADSATPPVATAPAADLATKLGLPTTLPSKPAAAKAPAKQ
ncbi:peptidylprolyl isomerase [Sphingomonas sp. BIUV-7]|uniref:Peptidyl-prolyl cis-trans isomerase n=1 Tax=Sphingomonas natans TaxID=3063330 RepID=A0ABT8Y610_9SPHN|nr:peptidylprolyl isomerase [Sphingomonas sp. BIUV-7]MDO6413762.1 peptidylprolyl isomerase [Sphingomonas sp. BIUV-7]